MIECRTIGTWGLRIDGRDPDTELTWKKNFALLVYLARSPRRTRTRDHIIGMLWADRPEHKAKGSLNEALKTLRRKLPLDEKGLTTDGERLVLASGAIELDIERLEYLARIGDWKQATELIAQQGECVFLAGLYLKDAPEFEDWLAAERAAVARRVVDVLTRRASELFDLGRSHEAEPVSDQSLQVDALYEPAVRTAMSVYAMCDHRTRALHVYEQFEAKLADQLGAAPSAETVALANRIKRGWGSRERESPTAARAGTEPARRAPLEDRVEALERLVGVWRACVRHSRRSILIVEGDPGMGKTRLVAELAARARVDGAVVVQIRAVEADLGSPFTGLLGLCRDGLLTAPGVAGAAPAALAVLRDAAARPDRLSPALDEIVQAIAEEQPLMIVLDDVQWLDRESLLAIVATLRNPWPARIALVVTTTRQPPPRPELEELRARLGREVAGATVRLGPLSLDAIRRMTQWTLSLSETARDAERRDRIARRVAADSAGIPLLAVALLDAIASGLELEGVRDGWPRPGQTLDETFPGDLPDNVVGAIRVMFGRANPDAQKVLTVLAVTGRRVPRSVLERAAELARERVLAALDDLEWKQWITADVLGYAFVARIFADVVNRDMVSDTQRLRIQELSRAPGS